MLLYHPVEDSNHCCYRLIRLLKAFSEPTPMVTLMICDFYSLFPGQLKYIAGWPRRNSQAWKILQSIPNEYEEMLNPKRVFFQLNRVQAAAFSHLQAIGVIEFSKTGEQQVTLNHDAMPVGLLDSLRGDVFYSTGWFEIITADLCKIGVSGKNGLKSKTGLMEYLYD